MLMTQIEQFNKMFYMDSLIFSLNAVLPIICLVVFGYVLARIGMLESGFVAKLSKFNFRWAFMAMIFVNMYSIESFTKEYRQLALFAASAILVIIGFGFFVGTVFIKDKKQKGVVAQACFRSNFAIIGVPLATLLFGQEGGSCAAVIVSVSIPLYNIFAVIALSIFVNGEKKSIKQQAISIMKKIIQNPLIDGIIAGGICLALRPHLGGWQLKGSSFGFVYSTIDSLAKMATPIALICLGAQFKFSAVRRLLPLITFCTFTRIVAVPAIGLFAASLLFPNFSGPQYAALLALFGTPVAVASAIMAEQMDNDGELAGQILVWTTLFSAFTLFAFILFFRSRGIF